MMSLSGENLKKRPIENGQCSTSSVRLKWKPRKVSAVRDFPAGCGADSLPVNMTHLEAAAPFIYTDCKPGSIEGNVTGSSVLGVEIEAIDNGVEKMLMENDVVVEVHIEGNDDGVAENNGMGLVEEAKEVEVGDEKEVGEREGQDLMKEELHEVEVDVNVLSDIQLGIGSKGKFSRRRVSAVRDFPPFCGWNAPAPTEEERLKITGKTSLGVGNKVDAALNLTEVVIAVGEVSQGNVGGAIVQRSEVNLDVGDGSIEKNQFSKNKNSGVVDEGGDGSCEIEEDMKVGDEGSARDGTVMNSRSSEIGTEPMNTMQAYNRKKIERAKGHAEKARQEIVVYSREKPLKRKPSKDTILRGEELQDLREVKIEMCESEEIVPQTRNKSKIGTRKADEDVSSQVDNKGLDIVVYAGGEPLKSCPSDDADGLECETEERGIVVGLMAKQGQKGNTRPDNVMKRTKVKRSSFTTPKKSKEKKVADGGKSEKRKSKSVGKVDYVGTLDLVVRNEEDVIANDEEQDEDSPSVQGAQEFDVNLPPFGPKSSSDVVYSGGEPLKSCPSDDADGLECEMEERGIVVGLMAKQGQKGHTRPDNVMKRTKAKRSSFTTPKKSKEKKVADGGKSEKRKSKSVGKVDYVGTLDLVVRNEEDVIANDEEQDEDSPSVQGAQEFDVNLPPFGPKSSSDARNRVRETLRLFQAVCRKLLQGEESKTSQGDESKLKQNRRIDLAAAKIVQEKGKEVNTGNKILGSVPGVEIGDEFQYRVELALVGVHRLYQAGIDYITHGDQKDKVAASIVASGGYDDELDNPDILIYSGSGGVPVPAKGKKLEDQKLERGNLALKNSILLKNPVRVIRGSKETKAAESSDARSKLVATYVYDGLYTVERYWQDPGPKGNLMFKFELRRIPGQPELAWKEVKKSKKSKIRQGLCVADISGGKESIPICAVNTIDDENPPEFTYINKMIYPAWYNPIPPLKGCDCAKQCYDRRCACASKNGGELPYNRNGAIVEIKPLVYECGPSCKCPPSCYNRVTQHGIKIQLEIFKTETRGWGVRSLNSIPSGSFICEYIGELLEDIEAERRTGNDEYLFDIGQNYTDCSVNPDAKISSEPVEEGGFTIDAVEYGNVGRFVNHSCSPNLYAQNVLYDQEDKRMPHIMLFAAENIPPLQELTYHYNYAVDTVRDSDGNIKIKSCFCGSSECTGRMY